MTCYQKLINSMKKVHRSEKGVALFIVLASLATLAIFVGEITYTSQINQKLAYDRLDQIKAHALAKSGLRIALLRIRAYSELKKTVSSMTGSSAAAKSAADALVPKAILEKIWSEPITIPFSGDVSALPTEARDALVKFRKDSGMEGKLYLSIEAQSSKFNLNSLLPSVAANPSPSPSPKPNASPSPSPTGEPTASPAEYSPEKAQAQLLEQIKQIFTKKFEESEKFKDQYRNFRIEDLVQEMIGWADIGYETLRSQHSTVPFKMAPYYDMSELHYLTTMDDEVYDLIAPQFNASMSQGINVNTIKAAVLRALVPPMTDEEAKAFFEYRDIPPPDDHSFKSADDFFKYIGEKVAVFQGSKSKLDDLKSGLAERGILIITDEEHFKVHIEATVQQTKRTLEAWVSVVDSPSTSTTSAEGKPAASPTPAPERSNLKVTQIRFL